jgi:hypothetical protein
MNAVAADPRNAEPLVKRKEELLALAKTAGVDVDGALRECPADNVAHIGLLARLLGIDALTALNPAAPLPQISNSGTPPS